MRFQSIFLYDLWLCMAQGGVTKALTIGRAATTVKPSVNGQGPKIALEWVKGQNNLQLQNQQLKTIRI